MKIIDQLKKVNLIQFVPAIFVISLVGNSVFGYTAPKSEKSKNNSENQVEAATTQAKKKTKKANAGDIDLDLGYRVRYRKMCHFLSVEI